VSLGIDIMKQSRRQREIDKLIADAKVQKKYPQMFAVNPINFSIVLAFPFVMNYYSISLWFKTTGIAGRVMRLIDLCAATGTQGIYIDISGTNQIKTLYN
jgi:hypothetical protein